MSAVCPRCKGGKMIDNGARDPQDRDDTECPRCDARGVVRAPQADEPLGEPWQTALDASTADVKARREEDRLLQQELAERDREWWS